MYNIVEDVHEKHPLTSIEIEGIAELRREMQEVPDAGPKMEDPAERSQ